MLHSINGNKFTVVVLIGLTKAFDVSYPSLNPIKDEHFRRCSRMGDQKSPVP